MFRKEFNYQADCFATKNEETTEVVQSMKLEPLNNVKWNPQVT